MERILSTGTAFNVAAAAGDAGQLGMVVGFDGNFLGRISLLMGHLMGTTLGDFRRSDRCRGLVGQGNRLWEDLCLWFRPSLGLAGCDRLGDRRSRRPLSLCSQHPMSQH